MTRDMTDKDTVPIRIGISTCLLGEKVRYDGGHKHDRFLTDTLGSYVEWVPVCPEVEMGMGIPREPIRLVRRDGGVRLVGSKSDTDHTRAMLEFGRRRIAQLAELDLCGYVLKKDSPSCGMERVALHHDDGHTTRSARGLFAGELLRQMPNLPVEEEGRLNDPRLRENWIERVFAYRRLKGLWAGRWKVADLVAFHTSEKLMLLAHSPAAYARLGRLVASAGFLARDELRGRYEAEFMAALAKPATPGKNANVLQHMMGFVTDDLDADSRRELLDLIEDHRRGLVPLVVPLTLVAHHVRRLDVAYLRGQTFLEPHPRELMLRNHV
jgi:uncharacterized protein YbgA (DUF1722 family)/uncharacterized protein YbbK (DUF523 family)